MIVVCFQSVFLYRSLNRLLGVTDRDAGHDVTNVERKF